VLPGRRADGETPVRVACRVRLTCSFFTIRGLAPLEQVSANARGVGATEALVYQRATAQPASAGNVINKNNHLGAKSPIDSLPAHSPGSDDIRRSILARCVAASLGCAGRIAGAIGGKRSVANRGSDRRAAERRQPERRTGVAGGWPPVPYRRQCRQCGQVATAIPVPTDTISSKVTVREMRTRRIAEMGHPPGVEPRRGGRSPR